MIYSKATDDGHETKVTTLSNGLKVASQPKLGQFCTVGVIIESGPRYEINYPSGVSHFLEKLSFHSTLNYESKNEIYKELEQHGGMVDCQSTRDSLIYAASIDSRKLETAVKIIAEAILRPKILDEEVKLARQAVAFELEDLSMKPDQELILVDLIHASAYRSNTLGLPKLCPVDNLDLINRDILFNYIKNYHTPDRMAFAGVGVDHNTLIELVEKYFLADSPIWEKDPTLVSEPLNHEVDNSIAQYTGGLVAIEKDLAHIMPGPNPMSELVHLVLGLESCSHKELDDFIPTCVLNMIMGGGGSFSAGGPGKGMYTRLYTKVLNRYHWMYNATAYNHSYNESGLFCIHSSCQPRQLRELVNVIVREAVAMSGTVSDSELNRAKTQLQSMLLMNLEARPVIFEDIARQVIANGFRRPPQFFIDAISKVTSDDINRVARKMLKSKVSIAALGNLKHLPQMEDIELALSSKDGRVPKRFTLFR